VAEHVAAAAAAAAAALVTVPAVCRLA
jgi:hypothetical protein